MNGLKLTNILNQIHESEMISELDVNRGNVSNLLSEFSNYLEDNNIIGDLLNRIKEERLPIIYDKMVTRYTEKPSYFVIKGKVDGSIGDDDYNDEEWYNKVTDEDIRQNFMDKFVTIIGGSGFLNLVRMGDKSDIGLGIVPKTLLNKIRPFGPKGAMLVSPLSIIFISKVFYELARKLGKEEPVDLASDNYNVLINSEF